MSDIATPPKRHDTKNPLLCCERCHKAELLGRAQRRPVFRYDKVEIEGQPSVYAMYHGAEHVGTLSKRSVSGRPVYRVRLLAAEAGEELAAPSLRNARTLAEEAYTASWREGAPADRGPVTEL